MNITNNTLYTSGSGSNLDRKSEVNANPTGEFGAEPKRTISPVGMSLKQRLYQVKAAADLACQVVSVGYNHGPRMATTAATFGLGAQQAWNGNYATAAGLIGTSAVEMRRIYKEIVKDPSKLQSLLNDVEASITMVKGIEEANKISFGNVNQNLELVENGFKEMKRLQQQIVTIAEDGNARIGFKKQTALNCLKRGSVQYNKAQAEFTAANGLITDAQVHFDKVSKLLPQAIELAKAKKNDAVSAELFAKLAMEALDACEEGQKLLDAATAKIQAGTKLLKKANGYNTKAAGQLTRICAIATKALDKAQDKAENTGEELDAKKAQLETAQSELKKIGVRNEYKDAILDLMMDDVKKAQKIADEQYGLATMIVTGTACAATTAVAGPVFGTPAGLVIGQAFHNRGSIANAVNGIFATKHSLAKEARTNRTAFDGDHVRFDFDEVSTGIWGRLRGRSSKTQGTVKIQVGEEVMRMHVDLNNEYAIKKSDLLKIQRAMIDKIKTKEVSIEEALKTINELETMLITARKGRKRIGLVPANSPFFMMVKEEAGIVANPVM